MSHGSFRLEVRDGVIVWIEISDQVKALIDHALDSALSNEATFGKPICEKTAKEVCWESYLLTALEGSQGLVDDVAVDVWPLLEAECERLWPY